MRTLTLEDCFKYPDAEIKNERLNKSYQDFIDFFKGKQYECWVKQNLDIKIEDCKLILRPLSSLTDKERKKLKRILICDDSDLNYFINCITLENEDVGECIYLYLPKVKKAFDYLRSINIDIDNLQEQGVAVYE